MITFNNGSRNTSDNLDFKVLMSILQFDIKKIKLSNKHFYDDDKKVTSFC